MTAWPLPGCANPAQSYFKRCFFFFQKNPSDVLTALWKKNKNNNYTLHLKNLIGEGDKSMSLTLLRWYQTETTIVRCREIDGLMAPLIPKGGGGVSCKASSKHWFKSCFAALSELVKQSDINVLLMHNTWALISSVSWKLLVARLWANFQITPS